MRTARPLRLPRQAAVLVAALALSACAGFVPQPGPDPEPDYPVSYRPLTTPIVAIGDTQEHESTGVPLHDNDNAIDAFVEVTQRPPEQPLFGRRIMEWALQSHRDEPFLHLGDVMDLSCRAEAERMSRIFSTAGRSGAIVPGNHDGLMFGVYGYNPLAAQADPGALKWDAACRRGAGYEDPRFKSDRESFTKRDFIAFYLETQARGPHPLPGLNPPPPTGSLRMSWKHPDANAFVSAIEARLIDGANYADSFVAQRLRLPRAPEADRGVVVIAIDTNQAGPLVSAWDTAMGRSPGSVGHVRTDQIDAIRPWIAQAVAAGDIVVFAGHHNWGSLGLPSRVMLRELMSGLTHPLVYLSAHTHRGFWAVHRALDRRPLLELNVSSLSDWPIAYRRIRIAHDAVANRLKVEGELMPAGERPHASDADLLAAWQAQTCERAGFRLDYLRMVEKGLVERQRATRGGLLTWIREEITGECTDCELDRYVRANAYQDEMLLALIETGLHLGPAAAPLAAARLPAHCGRDSWYRCASRLLAEAPTDLAGQRALFRRKAALVEVIADRLDDLEAPEAKAYMTCRAVQAAKVDFDETPDDRNVNRGEAKRRSEQFFRVEASVGMQ
jgi:hypothetical protein